MKFTHALKHSAVRSGLLAGLMAATFCGQAQAAAVSATVATGTNASLKITDVSSGSNSGSSVPGTLFWNVSITAGNTFDTASADAINLWGAQSSSGSLASGIFFGVFAGTVTPTGSTVPSPNTPLFSTEFGVGGCPLSNGSYSCNQFAWKPSLTGMGLGVGDYTIAVYSISPQAQGGNGNVWKTGTRGILTTTPDQGCGNACTPDPEPEDLPLPGSAALLALGLLGLGAARRKTA